jgi:hypothetical protein
MKEGKPFKARVDFDPVPSDAMHKLPGGATRSERAPDYMLIPAQGLRCIVDRFELGSGVHGAWQWQKSMDTKEHAKEFCLEAINHAYTHLAKMQQEGTVNDDHLGAVGWAVCVIAYARSLYGEEVVPKQPNPGRD